MKRLLWIAAVILFVVGLLWIGQGTNLLGGSQMSGNTGWAVIGVASVAAALALFYRLTRRGRGTGDRE